MHDPGHDPATRGDAELPDDELDALFHSDSAEGAYPLDSAHYDASAVLVAALDVFAAGEEFGPELADEALAVVTSADAGLSELLVAFEHQARALAGWCLRLGRRVRAGDLLSFAPVPVPPTLQPAVLEIGQVLDGRTPANLAEHELESLEAAAAVSLWSLAALVSRLSGASLATVAANMPGYGEQVAEVPSEILAPLEALHTEVHAELVELVERGVLLLPLFGELVRWTQAGRLDAPPTDGVLCELDVDAWQSMDLWGGWPVVEALVSPASEATAVRSNVMPGSGQSVLTQVALQGSVGEVPVTGAGVLHSSLLSLGVDEIAGLAVGDCLAVLVGRTLYVLMVTRPEGSRAAAGLPSLADAALGRLKLSAAPSVARWIDEQMGALPASFS